MQFKIDVLSCTSARWEQTFPKARLVATEKNYLKTYDLNHLSFTSEQVTVIIHDCFLFVVNKFHAAV